MTFTILDMIASSAKISRRLNKSAVSQIQTAAIQATQFWRTGSSDGAETHHY